MRWNSSPTRREITLAIFSLTVFILSYNLDSSLRIIGLDPLASEGAVLNKLGLTRGTSTFDKDGRRPLGWRDRLEDVVFGDWAWDEDHVAGDGAERSQIKGMGPYGALWAGRAASDSLSSKAFGETTADDVIDWWGAEMPVTSLVKHVPGYTILDNIILFNGTVYIVTDTPTSFPSISSIVSKPDREWKILSSSLARSGLGQYGGKIQGVTWISTDTEPHNSTLVSLWRTYSSLDAQITSLGETSLPPPRRLIFPYIPTFSEPEISEEELTAQPPRRRRRSDTGIHPSLAKTALPTLGFMFQEDWEDFQNMQVPYLFERVVIADRKAAVAEPPFASAFELEEPSEHWWEPIRRNVALHFDAYGGSKGKKMNAGKIVTYVHNNDGGGGGLRLRNSDHNALVKALNDMQRDYGYEVHIVSSNDLYTKWQDRMGAVVRSTVMIGPHGSNLAESVFLNPSPQTTLMEFFPAETFTNDWEVMAKKVGMKYIVWSGSKISSHDKLPAIAPPSMDEEVSIDALLVSNAIREIFGRK